MSIMSHHREMLENRKVVTILSKNNVWYYDYEFNKETTDNKPTRLAVVKRVSMRIHTQAESYHINGFVSKE